MEKNQIMSLMSKSIDENMSFKDNDSNIIEKLQKLSSDSTTYPSEFNTKYTCWNYWKEYYYPSVIKESYPVYIQERAKDKGKQAFEIIKILKDKKLVNLHKVGDFIDLMDELIKIL